MDLDFYVRYYFLLLLLHELLHRIKHFSLKGEPQLLSMCPVTKQ